MATIGIDVTALSTPSSGGIGTSQYQTMQALAKLDTPHRFVMYAAKPPVAPFTDQPLDLPWELRLGRGPLTASNIVWMQTGINRMLAADKVEVFWGPRHLLPFGARNVAKVATIHDFWHRYLPEQQPPVNRAANDALIRRVARSADELVTPSAATADDLSRFYGVERSRIAVVPWGVDRSVFSPAPAEAVAAAAARIGIERPYLLSLDVFNPRKNFSAVLRAVAELPEDVRERIDVVGVGRPRATAAQFDPAALAVSLGLRNRVRLAEDVSRAELVALMTGAAAFVYPSVYEGFGMPVLEAMACGSPVISTSSSSLPEVAGEAALLVSPQSTVQLSSAIRQLVTDTELASELAEAGVARAAEFTWQRTAEGMIEAFERGLADLAAKRGAR